jgi:hypothetical protein
MILAAIKILEIGLFRKKVEIDFAEMKFCLFLQSQFAIEIQW